MSKKKIAQCETIFLDSGVLIDILKIDLSSSTQEVINRIANCSDVIKNLSTNKAGNGNKRAFQVSAISIAEIFHIDEMHEETIKAISFILNSSQVEIFSFDGDVAEFHNRHLKDLLPNKSIDAIKAEGIYQNNGYVNIKERIRKDMLIIATAKYCDPDIVLTTDSGFKLLCDKIGLFCINMEDEKAFIKNSGGDKIYEFA